MNKISVVIPNYNHSKYLPECIESFLEQSYRPDEILIIDDGSTDNSIELIESYQKRFSEICLIKNVNNYGIHYSFNKAIAYARNALIAPCSADDFIFPGFLEKAIKLFDQNEGLGFVFADKLLFNDEKPYRFISTIVHTTDRPRIFTPEQFVEISRNTNFYVSSSPAVYKKDLLLRYGGYKKELLSLTDYYLNAQISLRHPIGYIPEPLGAYRLVSNSYGASIRFAWKKRIMLLDRIMTLVMKKEDRSFRRAFLRSGLLSFNGYFILLYLILHPRYWMHFPFVFYKVMMKKLAKSATFSS